MPRPCEDCEAFAANREYLRFSPACLQCGGRYLWAIQRQPMGQETKLIWLRRVLADWVAYGHDEQELRALAKRPWGRGRD